MRSRGECRKRGSNNSSYVLLVPNKDDDDTVRKVAVVERGIAKLKILTLLHNRSEKTMALKSDQKHEAAVVLADERVDETAVTCDETFDLSYEEVIAEKGLALICKGTTPDPEFAGEGGASENFLDLSMESMFTFSDDEESHDSGSIVFPEDEEESISLARVSTELVSKVIDEEGAAQSDNKIKSQLQTTTMYPKRDAKENDNAETTSTTIGMKDAPNPTNTLENIKDFARMISSCQTTFADSFVNALCVDAKFQNELMERLAYTCSDILYNDDSTEDEEIGGMNENGSRDSGSARIDEKVSATVDVPVNASSAEDADSIMIMSLSEDMHRDLRIDRGCGTYGCESNQDFVIPDPHAFCADTNVQLELMEMIAFNSKKLSREQNSFDLTESCDDSSTWNSLENNDCSFTRHGNMADFLFDEISIESTHNVDNAALAENDEQGRVSDGNGNAYTKAVVNGRDGISYSGSLNKKVLTKDDNANLSDLSNGISKAELDNAILHDLVHLKQHNFDLRKPKAARSKTKFGLLSKTELDNAIFHDLVHLEQHNFDLRKPKDARSKRKWLLKCLVHLVS